MINKIIKDLKKEIEYWDDIEKQIDNCPKENYKEFTRLEKLWINCPIDKLKTKLQAYEDAQRIVCEEIKKGCGEYLSSRIDKCGEISLCSRCKELLKKFQGEEK